MNNQPLVSVICLCYNQADFVIEAINSVRNQTYPNVQLIIVDDASTDNSQQIITDYLKEADIQIDSLLLKNNQGNCAAFNQGLHLAKGKYIIDLAADDVLLPQRVEVGVKTLEELPDFFGVHYSEAILIDHKGAQITQKKLQFPDNYTGDIYQSLISRYWINPATMMMKHRVLKDLDGYDESLSYEDFDFWIRSARKYHYSYSPEILVKKRITNDSLSSQQNEFRNKHEWSTFRVCEKIKLLNNTPEENNLLKNRCLYEIRRCIWRGHLKLAVKYFQLYSSID